MGGKLTDAQRQVLLQCLYADRTLPGEWRQATFPKLLRRMAEVLAKSGLVQILPALPQCFPDKTTTEVESIIGRRLTMGDLPQSRADFRAELTGEGRRIAEELEKMNQVAEVQES